jgi:ATP phosphoribosyltransferase
VFFLRAYKNKKEKMKEKITNLILPKGEWLDSILIALKVAGMEVKNQPRSYEYTFVNQALPIVFQAFRSKEVVDVVTTWGSSASGGWTGSDIAAEENLDLSDERSWQFPLSTLNPNAPKPQLYLGSTPQLRQQVPSPTISDLEGGLIYTEYPNLTRKFLGQTQAEIKGVGGGSEGYWRTFPRNTAIVSIRNTDATMKANQIELIKNLMEPTVVFIESANASKQDQSRIDDLRELIYIAVCSGANNVININALGERSDDVRE